MLKKLTSVVIITAIVFTLEGTSAFAQNKFASLMNDDPANTPSEAPAKVEVKPNEQLKNKMLKLVADAKAGKLAPAPKSQTQATKGNNLSKRTKIIIGVGAALVVTAVIVFLYERKHFFDDFRLFDNRH